VHVQNVTDETSTLSVSVRVGKSQPSLRLGSAPRQALTILLVLVVVLACAPLANAAEDTEPPSLVGLAIAPSSVDTSSADQLVTITVHLTDGLSGVSSYYNTLWFDGPGGRGSESTSFRRVSGTASDGTYEATIRFPRYSKNGVWKIEMDLEDNAGNRVQLGASQLEAKGLPATVTVGPLLPAVNHVSPQFGRVEGGDHVMISGEHLEDATAVDFGGRPASFERVSSTEIRATTPAAAGAGTVDVTVTTGVATSEAGEVDHCTYVSESAPTLNRLTPKKGPASGGTTVTITGENLGGVTQVMFGSRPGTKIDNISKTQITVVSPANTAEAVPITVATPYGTTPVGNASFKYERPIIEGFSQHAGSLAGGNTITVSGYGFNPGTSTTSFTFKKGVSTQVECASANSCAVLVPAAAKRGAVDVIVAVGKAKSKKNPARDSYTYE
jgi:IPT/TIG domain